MPFREIESAIARIGIIAYGSTDAAVQEARDRLRKEGVETSYLRLRALPLGEATRDFVAKYDSVYVVEMNQDGQMHQLVQLHVPEHATALWSEYGRVAEATPNFAMKRASQRSEIYPVFRELFRKEVH